MNCAKCNTEMEGAKCKMCKGPMECNGDCACKMCNRSVKKEEAYCEACMAASGSEQG